MEIAGSVEDVPSAVEDSLLSTVEDSLPSAVEDEVLDAVEDVPSTVEDSVANGVDEDSIMDAVVDSIADAVVDSIADDVVDSVADTGKDSIANAIADAVNDAGEDAIEDFIMDAVANPVEDAGEIDVVDCPRCRTFHAGGIFGEACRQARCNARRCARCGLLHEDYDGAAQVLHGMENFDCKFYIPVVEELQLDGETIILPEQVVQKLDEMDAARKNAKANKEGAASQVEGSKQ
ncbi:unnamed protein product [Urochloa humidicola]